MKFLTSLTFLLVAMVTVDIATGQIYDDWIKTQEVIGQPITINCSEYCDNAEANGCYPRSPLPEEYTVVRSWMGPAPSLYTWNVWNENMTGLNPNNISQAQCPSCEILDNGWTFRINSFDPTHHVGIYHCMLYNESMSSYFLIKWGVNMKGPYFEDLLEKYEQNIIFGVSAFGSFLFIAFAIILTYKFRWISDETEEKNNITYGSQIKAYGTDPGYNGKVEGKINPVFEVESPPHYNGTKAQAEVHNPSDDGAQPGTSSSSSSSSEGGSLRRRETEDETTSF